MAKALMIQGTGSNVGKSTLVAGLCRYYARQGLRVRPFKPQNISNNAAVTEDGGEIGRAQALQARAAGVAPRVDMNPVLLKPETHGGVQVIVQGKRLATQGARDQVDAKHDMLSACVQSFHRLAAEADLVIIEGAGSPAEINLRAGDIANMGFAEAVDVPVVLASDIERGGVIAQVVGTKAILPPEDAARIRGFLINKFHGDASLFDEGLAEIVARTGWTSLGVLPWFADAWKLPAEDIMDIRSSHGGTFKVAVPRLNGIANFDDLDPLSVDPNIAVQIVEAGQPLPGDADLVLIPGSKSTIADLAHFRAQGWDVDLIAHIRRGGHVLGVCGGYQMLGRRIADPEGIEGLPGEVAGLGHLDVETTMGPYKHLRRVCATHIESGTDLTGYEIHIGETTGPDTSRGWLRIDSRLAGATSADGKVRGCYVHGLFEADAFRAALIEEFGGTVAEYDYGAEVEATLDALAEHMATALDLNALERIMGTV